MEREVWDKARESGMLSVAVIFDAVELGRGLYRNARRRKAEKGMLRVVRARTWLVQVIVTKFFKEI